MQVVLQIKSLQLKGFPLVSIDKESIQKGFYFKIENSESNNCYLSHLNSNLARLYWETDIPLYISNATSKIVFSLAGVVFGDLDENQCFSPWNLMHFNLNLKDLEESVYYVPLNQTIKDHDLTKEFENFLQKTHFTQINKFEVF